jgi:hypothetical protein
VSKGRAAGSLLVAPALALGACGERTLNTNELETKLKEQLDASAGVSSRSVSCPEGVTAEKGKKFNCTLTAPNGDPVRVEVTLTNDQGGFTAQVPRQRFR